MNPRYEVLNAGFSTADAEKPGIIFEGDTLRVTIKDWRERIVHVVFSNVIGFSWDANIEYEAHRPDETYIVHHSPWLAKQEYVNEGEVKHFRLCFNAAGVLDVLASGLEVEPEQSDV